MQHLLTNGPLLDSKGNLTEGGYAFSLVKDYKREAIKANKLRIKEWDYYYFGNEEYGVGLTIDDNGYMSLASISFLDFKNKTQVTKSPMGIMPLGKVNLPPTSKTGDVSLSYKGTDMAFYNDGKSRRLVCHMDDFIDGLPFGCDLKITDHNDDTMVIATPFNKKKHFYYNQKINDLEANGIITIGKKVYNVNKWYGVLDWGRGVWTYKQTWFWSSLSGESDGHLIGFNLGYGFGDTSSASENMFFLDKKGYKLEDVVFKIPTKDGKDDFLSNWKIESASKDIDLTFTPILNRRCYTNALIIASFQNQVFGRFSGYVTADKKKIRIDNVLAFAEKVYNKW